MPDLTLRLRVDPVTGRREIEIDYASDSDALPFEHEEEHRRLAAKVVNGGLDNPNLARIPEPQCRCLQLDFRICLRRPLSSGRCFLLRSSRALSGRGPAHLRASGSRTFSFGRMWSSSSGTNSSRKRANPAKTRRDPPL